MVVRDIWISGSGYNGSYGKALIENHDKLTLLRLVGVPTPVPGHDSRWYVCRVAGIPSGTLGIGLNSGWYRARKRGACR